MALAPATSILALGGAMVMALAAEALVQGLGQRKQTASMKLAGWGGANVGGWKKSVYLNVGHICGCTIKTCTEDHLFVLLTLTNGRRGGGILDQVGPSQHVLALLTVKSAP